MAVQLTKVKADSFAGQFTFGASLALLVTFIHFMIATKPQRELDYAAALYNCHPSKFRRALAWAKIQLEWLIVNRFYLRMMAVGLIVFTSPFYVNYIWSYFLKLIEWLKSLAT